jgi:hypothetical protein
MSDEKPVTVSKRRITGGQCSDSQLNCIVHYSDCTDNEVIVVSETQFANIKHAVDIRQIQQAEGPRLDDICSKVPVSLEESVHGIHRQCYKKFTNVSRFKIPDQTSLLNNTPSRWSSRTSKPDNTSTIFPQNRCIFCTKDRKKLKGNVEFLSKCLTETAERTIRDAAAEKNDFQLLSVIGTEDMRAKEARYHESCRREYVRRDRQQQRGENISEHDHDSSSVSHTAVKTAYAEAFEVVCRYVDQEILQGGKVVRMSMLHSISQRHVQINYPDIYNESNTVQKLKNKLLSKYPTEIQFWLPQAQCKSELVFSSTLDIGEAVETAFEASTSETRILTEAAAIIRRNIKSGFTQSKGMPWPPSVEFLQSGSVSPPETVCEFLAKVISGKCLSQSSDKAQCQIVRPRFMQCINSR